MDVPKKIRRVPQPDCNNFRMGRYPKIFHFFLTEPQNFPCGLFFSGGGTSKWVRHAASARQNSRIFALEFVTQGTFRFEQDGESSAKRLRKDHHEIRWAGQNLDQRQEYRVIEWLIIKLVRKDSLKDLFRKSFVGCHIGHGRGRERCWIGCNQLEADDQAQQESRGGDRSQQKQHRYGCRQDHPQCCGCVSKTSSCRKTMSI